MTITNPAARRRYENADGTTRAAVDAAFQVVFDYLKENTGVTPATDDRAENLVSAIFEYVEECRRA